MKKILRFKKQLSFLMLLILLCGLIAPVSEIKAEEKVYYINYDWTGSLIKIADKSNSTLEEKYGFMNNKGEVIVEPQYSYVGSFSEDLALVRKEGKYGYIDKKGREVIPLKFDYAEDFKDGEALVRLKGVNGIINKHGKVFYMKNSQEYFDMTKISDDLYKVRKDWNEECLIKKKGKVVVFVNKYDSIFGFHEGMAKVEKNGQYGFINKKGKVVVPVKYGYASDFHEGLAAVNGGGFINKKGKLIIPIKYEAVGDFHEGLVAVKKDEKCGFINKTGKVVVPAKYGDVREFYEGLAAVEKDGKWGFINKTGKVVIPFKYSYVSYFNEGLAALAALMKNGGLSYLEKNGKMIIPFKFARPIEDLRKLDFTKREVKVKVDSTEYSNQILYYSEYLGDFEHMFSEKGKEASVEQVINKKGDVLYHNSESIPFVYDDESGLTEYTINSRLSTGTTTERISYMFINKEGKKVDLSDYLNVMPFHEGKAYAQYKNGKWGYIDDNGNPITEFEYDFGATVQFREGIGGVCKNGKYGFIDGEGKVIVPIIHGYNGK